jgi:flagellar basal body rod protein FlgC
MIRRFCVALSGVVSSTTRQAVVADNIANSTSYLIGRPEAATPSPGLIATGG